MRRRITIIDLPTPRGHDINYELQWLGNALGLFTERDRDKSCFRVFVTLVKETNRDQPLSSDQIADQLDLSRGTVVHHINRLIDSGIVIHTRSGYTLRMDTLQQVVNEIQRDTERMLQNMKKISKDIDEWLGL
jgi:biotin operon repressor